MDSKTCTLCREVKPLSGFNQNGKGRLRSECKPCFAKRAHAHYLANREKYVEAHRRRRVRLPEVTKQERKRDTEKWKLKYPEKAHAHTILHRAVSRGKLIKPSACEGCSQPFAARFLHGHHADYSKPLDVQWLCTICHGKAHRLETAAHHA